eukprot:999932-Prymnesium_polylepis.1
MPCVTWSHRACWRPSDSSPARAQTPVRRKGRTTRSGQRGHAKFRAKVRAGVRALGQVELGPEL